MCLHPSEIGVVINFRNGTTCMKRPDLWSIGS